MSDQFNSELEKAQRESFKDAQRRTLAPEGSKEGYTYLKSGLRLYDETLFGRQGEISRRVRTIIHEKGEASICFYGSNGQAAKELREGLGELGKKLRIDVISAADPRTDQEKKEQGERGSDEKYGIKFITEDLAAYQPENNAYDLALSRFTLQHMVDPLGILRKIYTSVKPDGVIAVDFTLNDWVSKTKGKDLNATTERLKDYITKYIASQGNSFEISGRGIYMKKTGETLNFPNLRLTQDVFTRIFKYEIV